MTRRGRVPEQLDIPLVWDRAEEAGQSSAAPHETAPRRPPSTPAWRVRIVLASIADAGITLVSCVASAAVAVVAGAVLSPGQLLLASLVGIQAISFLAVSVLWAWRGTPGMLLMDVGFNSPLKIAAAARVWLVWVALLPLAGIPWIFRRHGLDRLAGCQVNYR